MYYKVMLMGARGLGLVYDFTVGYYSDKDTMEALVEEFIESMFRGTGFTMDDVEYFNEDQEVSEMSEADEILVNGEAYSFTIKEIMDELTPAQCRRLDKSRELPKAFHNRVKMMFHPVSGNIKPGTGFYCNEDGEDLTFIGYNKSGSVIFIRNSSDLIQMLNNRFKPDIVEYGAQYMNTSVTYDKNGALVPKKSNNRDYCGIDSIMARAA